MNINLQGREYRPNPQDANENKYLCILCYFGLLFLIPYLLKRDSAYVKFHSNQGFLLFILNLALSVVSSVAGMILGLIPYIGAILAGLLGLAFGIIGLVLFILGLINTASGRMKELPIIGGFTILK